LDLKKTGRARHVTDEIYIPPIGFLLSDLLRTMRSICHILLMSFQIPPLPSPEQSVIYGTTGRPLPAGNGELQNLSYRPTILIQAVPIWLIADRDTASISTQGLVSSHSSPQTDLGDGPSHDNLARHASDHPWWAYCVIRLPFNFI
jgi:hypothetical protein